MSKKGSFFLAGLLGAAAGAIGGLLLAPQSGKETREDIKKLANHLYREVKLSAKDTQKRAQEAFGEVNDKLTDGYEKVYKAVVNKLAAVKNAGEKIDRGKYALIVDDVVSEFKGDLDATKTGAQKIAGQLKKDWEKMKKALA